jgi:DNA polymerase-3 subunit epsilon
MDAPDCSWLDSARVARRAWADKFAKKGYGLANVCMHLNYNFGHHDALEDAKAAGHIMLCAAKETGVPVSEWMKKACSSIQADSRKIAREGIPGGDLSGEVLVFTGALQMPRREAADMAASAGCSVASGVNRKTTLLVVGDQDIRVLTGEEKSSKHRKAEELITNGQNIRIICESDFIGLTRISN